MNTTNSNNNQKFIIAGTIALILIIGISTYAVSLENTRKDEQKKKDQQTSLSLIKEAEMMVKKTEDETMVRKEESNTSNNQSPTANEVNKPGQYLDYSSDKLALADNGNVLIFFNASWCSTCRATVKDINNNLDAIKPGLTILSADYDKETELKRKYGVVTQHTFVQVNSDGSIIKKQIGLDTVSEINSFVN